MERTGNKPRKFCFGNFTFGNEECMSCFNKADCWDDQAGWGISTVVRDSEGLQFIEERLGVIPDWVFKWDRLTKRELNKLRLEEPNRTKIYDFLNSPIQD